MSKLIIALYVATTSLGLIILKLGTANGLPVSYIQNKLHFNLNPQVLAGIILYAVSFLLYLYLISKYELGYIIPLATALVYVVIFVASAVVFKEVFTTIKIMGIALIIVGIVLLNLKS